MKIKDNGLELTLDARASEDPRFSISWALDESVVEKIRQDESRYHQRKIHSLIVFKIIKTTQVVEEDGSISTYQSDVLKKCAGLAERRCFFLMTEPGDFIIETYIVNTKDKTTIAFLKRAIMQYGLSLEDSSDYYELICSNKKMRVSVGKEFFLERSNSRFTRFVEFPYSSPSKDQCQFRKRALGSPFVALGLGLVLLLVIICALVIVMFRTAVGLRRANLLILLKVWPSAIYEEFDQYHEDSDNFFSTDKHGVEREGLLWPMLNIFWFCTMASLLSVIVSFVIRLFATPGGVVFANNNIFLYFALKVLAICLVLLGIGAGLIGIKKAIQYLKNRYKTTQANTSGFGTVNNFATRDSAIHQDLGTLSPAGLMQPESFATAFRLAYEKTKSAVCKPYRG